MAYSMRLGRDSDAKGHGVAKAQQVQQYYEKFFLFFLVSYVEERPWWSIQSPNKGRKKKAKAKRRERSYQVCWS